MSTCVMRKIKRVQSRFADSEFHPYLEAFKFDCQVRNLAAKTLECYYERLGYLFDYLNQRNTGLQEIDKKTIQDYIMSLKDRVSDETVNGRIRAYKRFFNFLCEDGLWDKANPVLGIKQIKAVKRVKNVIEPEIIQKIISSLNKRTFEGHRNLVMVLLFWDGMLRKNELLGMKTSELNLDSRLIKVFGKGRKERMVPLGVKTLRVLQQYIARWRSKFPGEYLICMRNGEPLKERHCHKIIQRLGKKQGVVLYPHLLRHSAATFYIRQGGNPVVLQGILGHTSLSVTQQYLHLSTKDALASYERLSPTSVLRV